MANDCRPAFSLFRSFNMLPTFDQSNNTCCTQSPGLAVYCTDSRISGILINGAVSTCEAESWPFAEIRNLPKLTNLTIENCIMHNVTLSWTDLQSAAPQLTYLQIPGNGLLGDFHPQLANLVYLDAGFNNFTGSINSDISNMPNLEYLGLQYNQVSGSLPDSISKLPLHSLDLAGTNVSGQVPNLSGLSLDYCNLGNACTNDQSLIPSSCHGVSTCGAGQNGSSPSSPPASSVSAFTIAIVAIGIALVAVGVGMLVLKKRKGGFVERPWTLQRDEEEERQPITMVEVDDAFELTRVKPME